MRQMRAPVLGALLLLAAILAAAAIYHPHPPAEQGSSSAEPAPEPDPSPPVLEIPSPVAVLRTVAKPLNILVMGVDEGGTRTDVIFLVHWEPAWSLLNLVSLPRDSKVPIPCPPEIRSCISPDKLNHAYAYGSTRGQGPELARATVEQFLGITIDHHLVIDFESFQKAVDTLGGVTVEIEPGMEDVKLYPGVHKLDGKQALRFVRYRDQESGDIGRIRRTQRFVMGVVAALREQGLVESLPPLIRTLSPLIQTDIQVVTALQLADTLSELDPRHVRAVSLPGEPTWERNLWFWAVDEAEKAAIVRAYITDVMPPQSE